MFKVGDLVDIKGWTLTYYGKIVEIIGNDEARISLKTARMPTSCKKCGEAYFLLVGFTNGVVCVRTGCGYEHGFIRTVGVFRLHDLINISEQRFKKTKEEFKKKIFELLESGVVKRLISNEQRTIIKAAL